MTELEKKYRNYLWLFLVVLFIFGTLMLPDRDQEPSTRLEMNVEDLLITGPSPGGVEELPLRNSRFHEDKSGKITPQLNPGVSAELESRFCPNREKILPELVWYSNRNQFEDEKLEILMVFSPNFKTDAKKYESVAKTILNFIQVPSAIAILKYRSQNPNPLELVTNLQRAKNYANECGFERINSIFLVGHGLGGMIAQKVATKITSLRGLILMGSFLAKTSDPEIGSENITGYPLPVLTVSGEWDANTRLGFIYREFHEFQRSFQGGKGEIDVLRTQPVLVLKDLNGSTIVDGTETSRIIPTDIAPEIAIQKLAEPISSFVHLNSPEIKKKSRELAARNLEKLTQDTTKILAPYENAHQYDEKFCLNILNSYAKKFEWNARNWKCELIHDKDLWDASISQPTFYRKDGTNYCKVHQFFHKEPNQFDLGNRPFGSESVHCKFKSAEAMMHGFNLKENGNKKFRCFEANQLILNEALSSLSSEQLDKLESVGRKVSVGLDLIASDPIEWLGQPLVLETTSSEITVKGVSLETPIDKGDTSSRGLHYCKLLSMSRAVEILTVDALLP